MSGMIRSNVLNDAIVISTRFNTITGASWGRSSHRSRCQADAPSRSAASCSSLGTRCSPAYCRIMLNAQPRQTFAPMTENSASVGEEIKGSGPMPTIDR